MDPIPTESTRALRYPRVLSIAGSDSGGGAGIQADLKTFSAMGCYGMTAITALTAQNTQGVRAIHGVPAAFLKEQLAAVIEDIGVDAVKIGMLHAPDVVEAVAWAIEHYQLRHVVLDPVMVATSGDALIEQRTIAVLVERLFPRVSVITPNMDEAGLLLGRAVKQTADLEAAAADLLAMGAPAVLLKGGHLADDVLTDILASRGQPAAQWLRLKGQRIASHNVHGTGCTLSSAIAAHLALGHGLQAAVQAAHVYIRGAIQAGANVTTGHGHGPLNHGYAPVAMKVLPI